MFLYRLLRNNSELIFFIALMIVVVSMPLSRFGLSFGQFSILGIWIIEGRFREKVKALFTNKAALVLVSFYLMHVLGLIYTDDLQWAFKDLRVKLPLLFLPIVFATSRPLSRERTDILLMIYVAAVLVASLISLNIYLFGDISNFRELSPFISHIRLSLNVCLAIFFLAHFGLVRFAGNRIVILLFSLIAVWLIMFLLMIESVTGIIIVLAVAYAMIIAGVFKVRSALPRVAFLMGLVALPLIVGIYLNRTVNNFINPHKNDLGKLELLTTQGNPYQHDTIILPVESGSFVGIYVCEQEMRTSWNAVSDLDFDGKDRLGQELKYTLIRYLNSKGLRKDSEGVDALNEKDIRNVEKGVANVSYTRPFSLNSRLYKLLWEYQVSRHSDNPGGHSITQRFEFWRVSVAMIRDNFLFGVGTGDIENSYIRKYESLNSKLELQYRHRAHNQFLAIFVTFGIVGLLWFILFLVYPGLKMKKLGRYRYFVFWVTLILSMLVEDTLETQMGATLFAFFNSFLLFGTRDD